MSCDTVNERLQADGSSKSLETEPTPTEAAPTSPDDGTLSSIPVSTTESKHTEAQVSSAPDQAAADLDDRPETIGESAPLSSTEHGTNGDTAVPAEKSGPSGEIEERTPGDGEGGEANKEMVIGILNSIVDSVVKGKRLCHVRKTINFKLRIITLTMFNENCKNAGCEPNGVPPRATNETPEDEANPDSVNQSDASHPSSSDCVPTPIAPQTNSLPRVPSQVKSGQGHLNLNSFIQ